MARHFADVIYEERQQGIERPLSQHQHAVVNARHPGCTLECCCECGEPTGRAGRGEDSIYNEDDEGPFCESCHYREIDDAG